MRTTMLNGLPITMLNGLGCGCENHKSMPMIQTFGLGAIAFNTEPTSDWSCQDWKYWHEELVKAFAEGKFASRIKYTKPEALRNANLVFNQWWSKLSGFFTKHQFCGYDSQFFAYFKSVGLENILSYFQGIVVPVASGAASVTENVANTATNASRRSFKHWKSIEVVIANCVSGWCCRSWVLGLQNLPEGRKETACTCCRSAKT